MGINEDDFGHVMSGFGEIKSLYLKPSDFKFYKNYKEPTSLIGFCDFYDPRSAAEALKYAIETPEFLDLLMRNAPTEGVVTYFKSRHDRSG